MDEANNSVANVKEAFTLNDSTKKEENIASNSNHGDQNFRNNKSADIMDLEHENAELPIIIDDLAELGVEWLITNVDEDAGSYDNDKSECLDDGDASLVDIEPPPSMPNIPVTNLGQKMYLVSSKDDGRTSTTLTWIRKAALTKDSASDKRITIRGLALGDLFHPRIYTLIQFAQSMDYASTEQTLANSCTSGILTMNFRTILDRITALRRNLLDIEIPGRHLQIVCTFPDHTRPPSFETLWKAYSIEGVPQCASQKPEREILARQIVMKNLPPVCDEDQIRKCFSYFCEEIEFMNDYDNKRCAIVTFVDVVTCHLAHARQHEVTFDDGTRPQIFLMTEMITNSKLMPKRAKEETEDERYFRHTFELLWDHQQHVSNAMRFEDRIQRGVIRDHCSRKTFQAIKRKLPAYLNQKIEDRALERLANEKAEKEKADAALFAAQQEALDNQKSAMEHENDSKSGGEKHEANTVKNESPMSSTQKRMSDSSRSEPMKKLPRRNNFRRSRGASSSYRRRMDGAGGRNSRDQLRFQGGKRGFIQTPGGRRSTSPGPFMAPAVSSGGHFGGGGGGVMGIVGGSPWLASSGPGASGFAVDRRIDTGTPGSYRAAVDYLLRDDIPSLIDRGVGRSLLATPPYIRQDPGGYVGREMDIRRSGELYQRRDALEPDYQRADYRGYYGKR